VPQAIEANSVKHVIVNLTSYDKGTEGQKQLKNYPLSPTSANKRPSTQKVPMTARKQQECVSARRRAAPLIEVCTDTCEENFSSNENISVQSSKKVYQFRDIIYS